MSAVYPLFAEKYELVQQLSAGGMGEVFLARQKGLSGIDKTVVVKRILRSLVEDPDFVSMFLDEARIAADLRHPNIVTIFEVGKADGIYYIAMEYLEGWNLGQIMSRAMGLRRSVPIGHALRILHDIADGLHYAHTRTDAAGASLGIVHRDLSLRNIMVTVSGVTKILDFGLAKARSKSHVTMPGRVKGTPGYIAPEQLDGQPVSPASDIFAMGTLLFEVTTRRRLFRRTTPIETLRAVKRCIVPRPTTLVRGYPAPLESVVLRALARDPHDRFQTAEELRLALDDVMTQLGDRTPSVALGRAVSALFDEVKTNVSVDVDPAQPDRSGPEEISFEIEISAVADRNSNLPNYRTSFVGRQEDMRAVIAAVRGGRRLITVYGPPGTGKTRFCVETALQLEDELAPHGGAWLVELDGARSADELSGQVAGVTRVPLAVSGDSEQAVAAIGRAWAGRGPMLVVLDNVDRVSEQTRDAVARWTALAPEVTIITTSRPLLGARGEAAHELAPLSVPGRGTRVDRSEAVALFLDRASRARAGGEVDPADTSVVAKIVRQLDGIPLAIELAAARMATHDASTLLEMLSDRFQVLRSEASDPTATPGHEALRDAIEWSWTLLEPWEKTALAQCAVFRGGFDMEAADAVLDLTGHPEAPWVVDVLQTLRNKSLVKAYEVPGFPGEPRCRQYVSIREFAWSKLEQREDAVAVVERHALFYLSRGRYWAFEAGQRRGLEGRTRLALDLANLLAVHGRSLMVEPLGPAHVERAMSAALAAFPVLSIRGPFAGLLKVLDQTLAAPAAGEVDPGLRAAVLLARGHIRRVHGDVRAALLDFREVFALARTMGARSVAARALTEMGALKLIEGQHVAAEDMLRRALKMHSEDGDLDWQGRTLIALGNAWMVRGDAAKAQACFERALPRFRTVGEAVLEGACLGSLGSLAHAVGRLEEAGEYLEQAVRKHRAVGAARFEGFGLTRLGVVLHERGSLKEARTFYERGAKLLRDVGDRRWEGLARGYLGTLQHEQGELRVARRHFRAAVACLHQAADTRAHAIFLAAQAAVTATMGRIDEALELLRTARAGARRADDRLLAPAVEVYAAFVELAQSATTEGAVAAEHLGQARRRLHTARALVDPAAGASTVQSDFSDLLRLSVRTLSGALA